MTALIQAPGFRGGEYRVPASKSHTIRRLLLGSLGRGVSRIERPLDSLDASSCAAACRALGARIEESRDADGGLLAYTVHGVDEVLQRAVLQRAVPAEQTHIDVGNSGTTLFLAVAASSLFSQVFVFSGDEQIARRSALPLLEALSCFGVKVASNGGCTPIRVQGPWKGGTARIACPTSQYLSALLIAAPLAEKGTVSEIQVTELNEIPYVKMTLAYLENQGLQDNISHTADYSRFIIKGGASYKPVNGEVSGDFSSAAFPAAAAVLSGVSVTLLGLDRDDTQGDKIFFDYLAEMGCDIHWEADRLFVKGPANTLRGGVFDLNATPDMLPVMAALASFAEGDTSLINVAHARIKETDRIAVMAEELGKLGVSCEEKPDALVIHGKAARAGEKHVMLDGHGDHRVVMALACAALGARRPVEILGSEAADISYPGFLALTGAECYT